MKATVLLSKRDRSGAPAAVHEALRRRGLDVERRSRARSPESDVVICRGEPGGQASGRTAVAALVINPLAAAKRASSPEETARLLHLHGIPVNPDRLPPGAVRPAASPPDDGFARVRIHVADLAVVAVDDEKGALRSVPRSKRDRIEEGACRAVYLLGLHYGAVDIAVRPSGRWRVERVDPRPDVDEALAAAYGSRIAAMAEAWAHGSEGARDAVLGADPEFALAASGGKLLYASRYVPHAGLVGYDRQSRANRGSVFPLAELRPAPSPSPHVLAANVEAALKKAKDLLPARGASWIAGSFPLGQFPAGGHVHFSGTPLTTPFLQALDNYLGLPVMLLEQKQRAKRRRRRYGRAGDFRRKEHGGFEYRVLPSWIVSPEATLAALALAKCVAAEWPGLSRNYLSSQQAIREFYLSRKARFRAIYPRLMGAVLRTPTGARFRRELEYFTRMVEAGEEWRDDKDIKAAWRI